MTSAAAKASSTSPRSMFHSPSRFPCAWTAGAPGASASAGSKTPGSSSYSMSTRSHASVSASSLSATTSATGSPWKRTRSVASTSMLAFSAATSTVWPGTSTQMRLCGTSSPNRMQATPGTAAAAAASRRVIFAEGTGARTRRACSMFVNARSPA